MNLNSYLERQVRINDSGRGGEETEGWRDRQKRKEGIEEKGVSEGTGSALISVQGSSCPSCLRCLQSLEGGPWS